MRRKTRARRHCLSPRYSEAVPDLPGLTEVLGAIALLQRSDLTGVVVSVHSSARDLELIAIGQDAADESGVRMDIELRGATLTLRFHRDGRGRG